MDYTKRDIEVKQIYQKAMLKRESRAKEISEMGDKHLEDNFWAYLGNRLEVILHAILILEQNPKTSKGKIDQAHNEFSKLVDIVNMYTIPEVIDELV